MYIYFDSLHVSSNLVLIIRRVNFINTTYGICHSLYVVVWYAGREGTEYLPTCHLHRLTYTRCSIDKIDFPDDEHKVVRNM